MSSPELLSDMETYLKRYVSFQSDDHVTAVALWTLGTYLWDACFDTYPYMVITAATKRAGKTRLSELVGFMAKNPRNIAGATGPAMLRFIRDGKPTIFVDEAESLSSESASLMRTILNVGYRRGQTIPRAEKDGVIEWPAYCPKCFILIGDVYDTLRDRAIVVTLRRADAPARFVYSVAEGEGADIRSRIVATIPELREDVRNAYVSHEGLPFLGDRDAEIWASLVALCEVVAPERVEDIKRIAVDMATMKTAPKRNVKGLQGAEDEATADEFAARLLADLGDILAERDHIFTRDVIPALKALPLAPWRTFRGEGLTPRDMGNMLQRFGVRPRDIRTPGGRAGKKFKGYRRDDVYKALNK